MSLDSREKPRKEYFPEIQYLRVLAISYVFIFHFTARRANLLPYGQQVEGVPWNLGWQGVYLFFIISGFVIAVSLEKSTSAIGFLKRRLIRIYPALFVILPVTYFIQKYIPYSEFAPRSTIPNLLTSVLLIPPTLSNSILGTDIDWLTLVLWSLKVEVCFYVLVFIMRSQSSYKTVQKILPFFALFTGLFLSLSGLVSIQIEFLGYVVVALKWFSLDFLNWFVLGIALRKWIAEECSVTDYLLFACNLLLAIGLLNYHELNLENVTGLIALVAVMIIALRLGKRKNLFKNRLILKAGNSSYEMYLIHQGIGFTLFYYLVRKFNLDALSAVATGIIVFLVSLTTSYVVWKFVNLKIGKVVKRLAKA
jgi:peptidoglycan/LPS O-acetylase OafA/YrhL